MRPIKEIDRVRKFYFIGKRAAECNFFSDNL